MHQHHQHSNLVTERARKSPYPAVAMDDAVGTVLNQSKALVPETVELLIDGSFSHLLGRVLAADILSNEQHPPFDASIKDGYAVIGAPVPSGADAVVQVEDTRLVSKTEDGKEERAIEILKAPSIGQDIRPAGCDIKVNERLMGKGEQLTVSALSSLASVGVRTVVCHKMPTVAVLSTGNELSDLGGPLETGKIRDSNRLMLIEFLKTHGFRDVRDLAIFGDDMVSEFVETIVEQKKDVNVFIVSGGVSMGEKDYVKAAMQSAGFTLKFGRVFMKPGLPTTFGVSSTGNSVFFGLPGNPVSAAVTFHLFVLPCLRKMAAFAQASNSVVKARLNHDIDLDPRPEYHRCVLSWQQSCDGIPLASSTGNQLSSRLLSLASANGLIVLPAREETRLKRPKMIRYLRNKFSQLTGEQKNECPICLEKVRAAFQKTKTLSCGHKYHQKCVNTWLKEHRTCPMCRTEYWGEENECAVCLKVKKGRTVVSPFICRHLFHPDCLGRCHTKTRGLYY